jgi:hypothetical protein
MFMPVVQIRHRYSRRFLFEGAAVGIEIGDRVDDGGHDAWLPSGSSLS